MVVEGKGLPILPLRAINNISPLSLGAYEGGAKKGGILHTWVTRSYTREGIPQKQKKLN